MVYERGFVQQAVSGTWLDADLRIVMPKLRTDPTEFAHLGLSTLEGAPAPSTPRSTRAARSTSGRRR